MTAGGLMVCGTTSNSGKTTMVAGLCRLLSRQGVSVAPFKAQNMALNSAVTETGHEIGRAQYLQAQAAQVTPEVAMNPILLKPTGERSSQVVVNGAPIGVMSAMEYHQAKPELFALVQEALADLRRRFDVVIIEGAGSPAEINLLDHDIVNLRLAEAANLPAIVVGDIDPGGVFASLAGTLTVLPDHLGRLIKGFVINKLRGDPALLLDGTDQLEAITGVPTLGVVPMLDDLRIDAEDSLALDAPIETDHAATAAVDVAVIRFPRISNFTDIDPLLYEPDVSVRWVGRAQELGRPDLVVLPGSKATIEDLAWMRERGLDAALSDLLDAGSTTVLGICGGYQMLGLHLSDQVRVEYQPDAVSAMQPADAARGLGYLPVATDFEADKVLAQRRGSALGEPVDGYQIHHGRVRPVDGADLNGVDAWLTLDGEAEGYRFAAAWGTTLHGLLDNDQFRATFLGHVAAHAGTTFRPSAVPFTSHRQGALDRLADALVDHLDLAEIQRLIDEGVTDPSCPSTINTARPDTETAVPQPPANAATGAVL